MLNPFSNRRLLRRGEPARAQIVEMTSPAHGASPSNVEMTLRVQRQDASVYEIRDRWMVSGTEPIGPGSELHVVIDPDHRHRVAIDWDQTRADYRERSEKRRELLSVGVPVPVSKIREVAEDIGYEPLGRRQASTNGTDAPAEEAEQVGTLDGAAASGSEDLIAKLERLSKLHEAGALSDGEFEAAKDYVLSSI